MAIPKQPAGSYFPNWLLKRRKRAEEAMISVIATTCWVARPGGVKLVEQLGVTRLSKSRSA